VSKGFFQDTIALVYDFDGTLSPQPMQEYTVLPKIGVEPRAFWDKVNREARETESDQMLVYMRHIIVRSSSRSSTLSARTSPPWRGASSISRVWRRGSGA